MNLQFSNMNVPGFATFAIIFGLVQMLFWLIVGWRAMRAHENIAASLDSLSRHIRQRDGQIPPDDHHRNA